MTNIDQFESVFKAADKPLFQLEGVELRSILIATDLPREQADAFGERVRRFLAPLEAEGTRWSVLDGGQFDAVSELLERVEQSGADLVCTYRNLHVPAREYPHSLGAYVDVLTQASPLPVLLMPHPRHEPPSEARPLRHVMAITDHLTGDDHLVSFAARCTPADGLLLLAHVEDQGVFERYIGVIGRLPSIDTDEAREAILQRLLKEPQDYIETCREVLQRRAPHLRVEKVIAVGDHLTDYRRLIDKHDVDLAVLNTKDEDQLAMHGLAYPLTVELRTTPLLLL